MRRREFELARFVEDVRPLSVVQLGSEHHLLDDTPVVGIVCGVDKQEHVAQKNLFSESAAQAMYLFLQDFKLFNFSRHARNVYRLAFPVNCNLFLFGVVEKNLANVFVEPVIFRFRPGALCDNFAGLAVGLATPFLFQVAGCYDGFPEKCDIFRLAAVQKLLEAH